MAIKKEVKKTIQLFVSKIKKEFKPHKIILYGSYAKNRAHKDSDIDIAVISRDFSKINHVKRETMLNKYLWGECSNIEPIAYTPAEFNEKNTWDIRDIIKKEGIVVYQYY